MSKLNTCILSLLFFAAGQINAQDLIVTVENDSINGKITKIENDFIYFDFMNDGKKTSTVLPSDRVASFKKGFYDVPELPVKPEKKRVKPEETFRISADYGPSWRINKTAPGFNSEEKAYVNELKSGSEFALSAHYFTSELSGWGIKFSQYRSSHSSANGSLSDDITVTYIGPSYLARIQSNNKMHSFIYEVSLGYTGYRDEGSLDGRNITITGGTFGVALVAGYELKIAKGIYLGIGPAYNSGILTEITVEENGLSEKVDLTSDENTGEGLGRIHLFGGLRFYF